MGSCAPIPPTVHPVLLEYLKCNNPCKVIGIVTLNHPKTRNAFGRLLIRDLETCLNELQDTAQRGELGGVILRSKVPGVFCAGADLKERMLMRDHEEISAWVKKCRDLFNRVGGGGIGGVPVIAAMDGTALGGGLELALACDLRVAGTGAKMGLVEGRIGVIPGTGGTQRLPRLVGLPKAKELIFLGRVVTAEEALSIGLVDFTVQQNDRGEAAYEKALEICTQFSSSL